MGGAQPFSDILRDLTRTRKQWCPFTHKDAALNIDCYRANPGVQLLVSYIRKYALCCRYLDCNPYAVRDIELACQALTVPEHLASLKGFETVIDEVKDNVQFIEADVSDKLSRLTCLECQRLDEAIECLTNYCFRASVVMAVSSVEARIAEMIRRRDVALYDSYFGKATLGFPNICQGLWQVGSMWSLALPPSRR
jgi:hypothetical protein